MALTKIKNISIDPDFRITGTEIADTFTLTARTVTVSTPANNTEAANKLYVDNAVAAVYNFKTIAVGGQSNIVADAAAATLTVDGSGGIVVTTDAANDTLTVGTNATSNSTANTLVTRDGSGNFSANVITANLTGHLTNARNISLGGDATGTASFDGSANVTITTTLANTGVTAQTYGSATQVAEVTVDSKGRITSASNINIAIPSTAITDWQEAVEDTAAASITSATHSGISFSYDDSNGTLAATVANQDKFTKIAVSGQSDVDADTPTDTLTLAGSTGLTITTDSTTDIITFTNSGVTSAAVSGTGLSINAATGAVTITSNATANNTASTVVARDASGDFSAGVITATLVGNVTGDVTGNITSTGSSSFSNIDVNGGYIDDTIIGGTTPQAITGTTITANTQFTGNLVGNVTGDVTSAGTSTFATVDVNGGNIDGTVIGGSTPAAADFTDVTVTGFLDVDGGTLYVDPTNNYVGINDPTPAAELDVNGDAIITGSLTVNTDVTVDGNLTVLGTTTTVESTVTTIVDPVLTVGQGTYGSNDGKARGIEFKYYDGANRIGFFGYDTTDGVFKFLKTASNNSEVFTGTAATIEANLDGYLVNARDIELIGDVTGLQSFDGSANIQITSTLANTGVTAGSYGANDEVATFTVDSKGRLTAAGVASINITSGAVSDFDEAVRDAAALMITSAVHTNVSVTYDDGADTLSFSVPGAESFSTIAVSGQSNVEADQANDTITFAGSTGLTITTDATTDTVTFTNSGVTSAAVSGTGISINASTGAVTITSDATSANTAGTIVARDGSGNFTAGVITADLVGNADTASTWATARTITLAGDLSGSVTIDGSGNETLTATIEPDSVALGTDTTGDYVEDLIAGAGIALTNTGGEGSTPTITNDDKGSDQMIFKSIAVAGETTVTAGSNNETLTLAAGTGVSLTTDNTTKTVTITNSGLNAFKYVAVGGQTTVEADSPDDTLTLVGGTAISLHTNATTDSIEIQNDGVVSLGTSGVGISVNAAVGVVTITSDATPNNTAGTIVSRDANGAFNAGDIGAEDITADSITLVNGVTIGGLTAGRVTFAGVAGLLGDSADLTFNDSTDTLATVNVTGSGTVQGADLKATNLTNGRVTFAGAAGLLSDSSDLTFNDTTDTLSTPNVNASTSITSPSITDSGLTAGRVTFAGVGGLLSDDSDLTYNSTTNTLSVPNISTSTGINTGGVTVSTLTQGRVTFAGLSGALVDDADMTFDTATNTLAVTNVDATAVDAGDVNISTNVISVASGDLKVAAGAGGHLDVDTHKIVNVVDPTANQDAATKKYVDDQLNSITNLNIDADSGGPSSVDLSVDTLSIDGTANEIETSVAGQTITIGLPNDVTIGNNLTVTNDISATGDVSATDVTASGNLSVTGTSTLTGNTGVTGDLTVSGVTNLASVSTTGAVTADSLSVTTTATVGGSLSVTGVVNTTTDVNVGGILAVTGATNVTTITSTGAATLDSLSVTNNTSVGGNLTVTGDLTVQGTLTSIQTTNTEVSDNTITLNNGEAGAGVTAGTSGLEVDRGSLDNATLLWNESSDTWEVKVGANYADFYADDITAGGNLSVTGTLNAGSAQFTAIDSTPIGSTTPDTGAFTTLTSTDLTATRVVFVGASDELVDDSDFTYDNTTDTLSAPNISASTGIVAGSATVSSLTNGRVTLAGASGLLGDTADLTYNSGTSTLTTVNVTGSGTLEGLDVKATSLTTGRVVLAGAGGQLVDDGDLSYDTATDTLSAPNISMSGSLATTNVTNSALTAGRVTFAGAGGLLSDDADLAFDTTTDTLSTVNVSATDVTASSITDSGLTNGRVTFAGSGGLLSDNANFTFNTGTDTLTTINLSATDVTASSITDSGLTSGRVTIAGAGGLLSDTANLTFNTGTDTLATVNVSATDVTASSITDSGLTATRIVFAGAGGLLTDDADLTFDTATNTLTVPNISADVTGNITGNITGNVTGDLTGDVKAANGTVVLDAGTNGTDATFTGDVTGNVTGQVTDISNHDLDDIGDVDLTGLQDQDTIRWDAASGTWVPSISGGFQMRRQRFTANGSSASFTLNYAPEGAAYLIVTVSGVPQAGDTFSVTGTTLTLGGTPQNGEIIEVLDFSTGVFSPAPNSTDDISEGSTNFYYTDTRVKTLMGNGTLNSHIIPATDNLYDLGSAAKRWRDLYLTGNTIYLGNVRIKDQGGAIKFVDSNGDPYPVDLGVTLDSDVSVDGGSY